MGRLLVWGGLSLALLALAGGAGAQAPPFTPKEERMEDLPDSPGREETFALCTACHGFKLVSNQGMSRAR